MSLEKKWKEIDSIVRENILLESKKEPVDEDRMNKLMVFLDEVNLYAATILRGGLNEMEVDRVWNEMEGLRRSTLSEGKEVVKKKKVLRIVKGGE